MNHTQPPRENTGTTEYRLEGILAELDKRFPGINTRNSGTVTERYYLKHIDALTACVGALENLLGNWYDADRAWLRYKATLALNDLKALREKQS
jgi:hypothetical protein